MTFFSLILISILSGVEVDLFIPSFPRLQQVFHLSPFLVQLTLSANFIAYCVASLFAGALGDRFNRRYVMLVSLLIFTLGSVFCVIAQDYYILLIGRFLQGVGMAGPSVLAFAIIADLYPISKQAGLLAVLNGLIAGTMAFAPLMGSYINFYFDWQGNFLVLLALGICCLGMAYFYIPDRQANPEVSLSLKAYWPLLKSTKLMSFILAFCFLVNAYWLFVGMAPILYMKAWGVPLKIYGYYQGSLAVIFSIGSLVSGRILHRYGQWQCLKSGLQVVLLSMILIVLLTVFSLNNPLLVTIALMIFSLGVVFPCNILFPLTLNVMPEAKARISALFIAVRLFLTAILLEAASYFYNGTFLSTGTGIVLCIALSFYFIYFLYIKGWIRLES